MKKLIARVLLLFLVLSLMVPTIYVICRNEATPEEQVEQTEVQTKPLIEDPILYSDIVYVFSYSEKQMSSLKAEADWHIELIESAIGSGAFSESACEAMEKEINRLHDITIKCDAVLACYLAQKEEYFYSYTVWQAFIDAGYTPESVAGILGNLMWETGGGTLAIDPCIYDPDRLYYGMCMWYLKYTPEIADAKFVDQLSHLMFTIGGEFANFGFCYKNGFTVDDFKQMTDAPEAALAFAKVYERCMPFSYGVRKSAAQRALEYFRVEDPNV